MCIPDGSGVKDFPVSGGAVRDARRTVRRAGDIPGFPADSDAERPGPQVVILPEMDWLIDEDGMVPVNDSNRT